MLTWLCRPVPSPRSNGVACSRKRGRKTLPNSAKRIRSDFQADLLQGIAANLLQEQLDLPRRCQNIMAHVDHRRQQPSATEPSASSSGVHARLRTHTSKRRGILAFASAAIAAALFVTPDVAEAQTTTFYLDRLFIGGAPEDAIGLWRPYWNPKTRFFGQLGMGFALNPFRVENHRDDPAIAGELNRDSGPPVSAQLISYLGVGTEILDRVSIQANFPIILAQGGNKTTLPGMVGDSVALETVAPMDFRLDARVNVECCPTRLSASSARPNPKICPPSWSSQSRRRCVAPKS